MMESAWNKAYEENCLKESIWRKLPEIKPIKYTSCKKHLKKLTGIKLIKATDWNKAYDSELKPINATD